ncbi:pyridine nucleotide-disulfide oxidoreductase [Rhodoblastus sphagnicola]|uniref:Pyridine nucleotide-disulfide oxidoreductase n=1 Tax=Rhodoblastus sphagnicola TaxID=333368 RepID=A0A2S6NE91_9HYPH|nr:FAD-dependent oxidoreductase [Rhodoblastus sphagnicola]MBB4199866.1 3-phenylpropionate/trans-cinnamate dioxygenase ferredoxin reductase subunit [Rhodoblastus sphagnicola]PPQ32923.1 pyridine nucleotide-disulfide oxidoreductase [Rhodoblastus sphagnicola]
MGEPIIIVGAGQAGLAAAEALRAEGWRDEIVIYGAEKHAPYNRPPLSKGYLLGETPAAQLTIRGAEFFAKKRIELCAAHTVSAIEPDAHSIVLDDGSRRQCAGLVLATGSRPRELGIEGARLSGVASLRTLEDSAEIGARIDRADNVVVIGGGFIGLEVAAAARKRGRSVIVLEAMDRLLARVASPAVSEYVARLHAGHGVHAITNAKVSRLVGENGSVRAVETADGRSFPADLVVVGVGAVANDELARSAGLACDRGVIVDACSRTSDPAIFAAGDCTARRHGDGALSRLESVQNAVEQGKSAAAALMGKDRPFHAAPWFWSDQYDAKLQMAGTSAQADKAALRGSMAQNHFSLFYFRGGKLIGVDTVNRPGDHMLARKLLDASLSPTIEQVSNPDFDLKNLLAVGAPA